MDIIYQQIRCRWCFLYICLLVSHTHLAKHNVLPVQPSGFNSAEEELQWDHMDINKHIQNSLPQSCEFRKAQVMAAVLSHRVKYLRSVLMPCWGFLVGTTWHICFCAGGRTEQQQQSSPAQAHACTLWIKTIKATTACDPT